MRRRLSPGKLNRRNMVLLALIALAGCSGQIVPQDPVSRRIGWFSLIGGDDIRAACAPAGPARYRFVYNAIYAEQVRVYDLAIGGDGHGTLDTTVLAGGISLGAAMLRDLRDLATGVRDHRILTPGDAASLRAAIDASGVTAPPPVGLQLRSDSFYWTVASCVDGQFRFTGFEHPSPRYAASRFPAALFDLDTTGVSVNPPRRLDLEPFELTTRHDRGADRKSGSRFLVEIGRDGMVR